MRSELGQRAVLEIPGGVDAEPEADAAVQPEESFDAGFVIAEANGPEGAVVEPTFPIEVEAAALIRLLWLRFGALGLRAVLL